MVPMPFICASCNENIHLRNLPEDFARICEHTDRASYGNIYLFATLVDELRQVHLTPKPSENRMQANGKKCAA